MNDVAPLAWLAVGALALTMFVLLRGRTSSGNAANETTAGMRSSPFQGVTLVTVGALHLAALSAAATWLDTRTVAIALVTEAVALVALGLAHPWRAAPSAGPPNATSTPKAIGAIGVVASLSGWLAALLLAAIALPSIFTEATSALEPALVPWIGAVLLLAVAAPLLLARAANVGRLTDRVALPVFAATILGFLVAVVVSPAAADDTTGVSTLMDGLRRAWWATDARGDGLPNAAFALGITVGGGLAWISVALARALQSLDANAGGASVRVRLSTLFGAWTTGCLAATAVLGASAAAREPVTVFDPALGREVLGAHHLEVPIARAHAPSSTLGQTIVLTPDTPLEDGGRYPIVYRADPRGAKIGLVEAKLNRVRLANDALARQVTWISFRSRERLAGAMPAFDLRVPVRAVVRRGTIQAPPTRGADGETPPATTEITVVNLEPRIDVDLEQLASRLDGPYVHLPDAHYVVTVLRTRNAVLGEHLTAYLDEADRGDMPPLRRIVGEMRYRGPYLDVGDARPPLAMVVPSDFPGRPGDVVSLRHEGPPRGVALGLLRGSPEGGELLLPAWPELAHVREAILRHRDDPALDRRIPLTVGFGDDGLLHARSTVPDVLRLVDTPRMKDFDGPFLAVPPTTRRYELRGDARLPATLAGFRTLVPLDAPIEMQGRRGELSSPHFLELDQAGFAPPYRAYDGVARVGRTIEGRFGAATAALFLACLGLTAGLALGLAARAIRDDVAVVLAPSDPTTATATMIQGAPGVGLVALLLAAVAAGHGLGMRGDVALLAAASVAVLAWVAWSLQRVATRG